MVAGASGFSARAVGSADPPFAAIVNAADQGRCFLLAEAAADLGHDAQALRPLWSVDFAVWHYGAGAWDRTRRTWRG